MLAYCFQAEAGVRAGVERCLKDSGPGPVANGGLGGRQGLKMADMRNKREKGKIVERNTRSFAQVIEKPSQTSLSLGNPA